MLLKSEKIKKNYGWIIVFIGFISMVIIYGTIVNSFGVFVIPLIEYFNFSHSAVSSIISFKAVGIIIGANMAVLLIRKKNARVCMMFFALIGGITAVLFSRGDHLIQFYFYAVLLGIAEAGTTTLPISILINEWFTDEKKGFALSIAYMGSGIGGLLFNPLLNNIIESSGWRMAFMTIGFLMLLIYIPVVGGLGVASPSGIGADKIGKKKKTITKQKSIWTYEQAIKSNCFWVIGLALILVSATSVAIVIHLMPYLINSGFSSGKAATITGISVGCIAGGKIIVGWLSDNYKLHIACIIGIGSLAISQLLLLSVQISDLFLIPTVIVYGIGVGSVTVIIPLITEYFFGEYDYTRILGQYTMLSAIGVAIGPLFFGIILDITGLYEVAFPLLTATTTIALSCLLFCFKNVPLKN